MSWWKILIGHICFWYCFQFIFAYIWLLIRGKGFSVKVIDAIGYALIVGIPSAIVHLIFFT